MKYIKTFEYLVSDQNKPQIGDYVICRDSTLSKKGQKFLKNNVGQIIDMYPNTSFPDRIMQHIVKFDISNSQIKGLLPSFNHNNQPGCRSFANYEIVSFAYDIEILNNISTINKYNL